jgi:hypothetical protein
MELTLINFVSHGLWSEEQSILLQHMHKKEFWTINVEISLNTKTRLIGPSGAMSPQPRFRV